MSCHFWLLRKRRAADKKAQEAAQDVATVDSASASAEENTKEKPHMKRQRAKKDDAQ